MNLLIIVCPLPARVRGGTARSLGLSARRFQAPFRPPAAYTRGLGLRGSKTREGAVDPAPLFRVDALVNPGRPFVMPQIRLHPSRPRVARAGSAPGIALRDPGMLELVHGQVFGLALDDDEPASAEASGHR